MRIHRRGTGLRAFLALAVVMTIGALPDAAAASRGVGSAPMGRALPIHARVAVTGAGAHSRRVLPVTGTRGNDWAPLALPSAARMHHRHAVSPDGRHPASAGEAGALTLALLAPRLPSGGGHNHDRWAGAGAPSVRVARRHGNTGRGARPRAGGESSRPGRHDDPDDQRAAGQHSTVDQHGGAAGGTTTGKCGHAALPVGGAGRAGKGRRRP